jgi:hypothetical protein
MPLCFFLGVRFFERSPEYRMRVYSPIQRLSTRLPRDIAPPGLTPRVAGAVGDLTRLG